MDIVKLVSQFVTPGALSQIATLLGISQADVQKGLGAAVPGVLASLLGAAQRPGAADALGAALTRASGEGGLATMLGRDPAAAAAAGSGVLGSLLGGGEGKLAEALGSYTGLSRSAGGALLGLAGSMALGALGGEAKAKGLDAKGVLGLLESNKDQIKAALPSGFASALAGSGLLGGLDQPAAAPAAPPRAATTPPKVEPPRTPPRAATTPPNVEPPRTPPTPARRRGMSWLWWLIAALIVIWLLWRFLAPAPEPVTEETAPPPAETTTEAPAPEPEAAPEAEPATEPAPAAEPEPAPAEEATEPAPAPAPATEPATPPAATAPATPPATEPAPETEPAPGGAEPATPEPGN